MTFCTNLHTLYSAAFISDCLSVSLKAVRSHMPTDDTLIYVCVCLRAPVFVCGCYNLSTSLKWVLCLGWWWTDLSSTCQLQLPWRHRETERDKERENTGMAHKSVDAFVTLKLCEARHIFLFVNFKMLTVILFIYSSCQHLVQTGVKTIRGAEYQYWNIIHYNQGELLWLPRYGVFALLRVKWNMIGGNCWKMRPKMAGEDVKRIFNPQEGEFFVRIDYTAHRQLTGTRTAAWVNASGVGELDMSADTVACHVIYCFKIICII